MVAAAVFYGVGGDGYVHLLAVVSRLVVFAILKLSLQQ